VPSYFTTVQNNRIKSTTNHIVSTLQFARQTAAINNTQVIACTPVADNCGLSANWSNGITLQQGDVKIVPYKYPKLPDPPGSPPNKPIIVKPQKPAKAQPARIEEKRTIQSITPTGEFGPGLGESGQPTTVENVRTVTYGEIIISGGTFSHRKVVATYTDISFRLSAPGKPWPGDTQNKNAQEAWAKARAMLPPFDEAQAEADYQRSLKKYDEFMAIYKNKDALEKEYNDKLIKYNMDKIAYEAALKKLKDDGEIEGTPPASMVTAENTKTLLAANAFASTVTVKAKLQDDLTSIVYNKDRIKAGSGQIDITDKRGKGEHSRTICINMLGNLKVVKGNENCP